MTDSGTAILIFESADEILWCDHSNETFFALLSRGTIFFSTLQDEISNFGVNLTLAASGNKRVNVVKL